MTTQNNPFWESKPLDEMNNEEWESLCDGCGQCCLVKLKDDSTDQVYTTTVSCKFLNINTCRCINYPNRKQLVPECLTLRPLIDDLVKLLPDTCAYRLLTEGENLPHWHPLISADKLSVINAGVSVCEKVISEQFVHPDDLENYVIV